MRIPVLKENNDYILLNNSRYFDKNYYLNKHPDLKSKDIDLVTHYLKKGWIEGYNPSILFDGNAYLQKYNDVKEANMNPLVHYLRYGQKEGRSISIVQEDSRDINLIEEMNSNEYYRQTMPSSVYDIYKKIYMGE